ncbi:hypothetical protein ACUXV3_13340 [Roseobacteraceae bacterium NS-SX3]
MDGLTPLERELLGYVEQLTEASKASAQELTASGQHRRTELDGLRGSMIALLRSQLSLVEALNGWMPESGRLNDSMEHAQRAKKLLGTR